MSALTSSPTSGTGKPGNGPVTELHEENVGGVVEHRDRLFVAGDHHHVVVRLPLHRTLRAEVLEVRIRVGDERVSDEEVVLSKSVASRSVTASPLASSVTGR